MFIFAGYHGVGSLYFGRDKLDGGYITTEWATFLFIPLFPVASYFVHDPTWKSWTIERLPREFQADRLEQIHRPHILSGYTATGLIIIAMILFPYVLDLFG